MKIYEIILFEDSVDSKVDLVKVKSIFNRWALDHPENIPVVHFAQHGEDRKDYGRNDSDPTTTITNGEMLNLLDKTMNKYGKELSSLPSGYEGVLQDGESDINVPFVLNHKPHGKTQLTAKTIMREPNFRAGNKVYRV